MDELNQEIHEEELEEIVENVEASIEADDVDGDDAQAINLPPAFVEQLAEELMLGELTAVLANIQTQLSEVNEVMDVLTENQAQLESDMTDLSAFISKAEHSLSRAQGFPVATEEVPAERMPELPYAKILSNLKGNLQAQLSELSPIAAASKTARDSEVKPSKADQIRNAFKRAPNADQPYATRSQKDAVMAELNDFVKNPSAHWDQ